MLSREANGRIRAGQPWSPQLGCINNEDGSVGGYSREVPARACQVYHVRRSTPEFSKTNNHTRA